MVKSIKPEKPYPEFPLFPHATGRWAKKIHGKMHYFGPWADPDAALQKYLDQKDDLHAGRTPRVQGDGLTIRDLLNRFLTSKKLLVDSSEITARTFADYHATCERIGNVFGLTRLVTDLAADDFERLRSGLAKKWGPVALGNEIQRIRVLFKYAYDAGLIPQPMRYGPGFKRPSKKVLRKARHAKGPRMFEAVEIQSLLRLAGVQMRAMILLGINCGLGNTDCGSLPLDALDLDRGWLNYPRPKTGIQRRCPLWPETVAALRSAVDRRPAPKAEADSRLLFITQRGASWAKHTCDNPVSKETAKLLRSLRKLVVKADENERLFFVEADISVIGKGKAAPLASLVEGTDVILILDENDAAKVERITVGRRVSKKGKAMQVQGKVISNEPLARPGLNFYALRHTFETIGGESRDQPAVDHIMGHARDDMASVYREKISDERLRAVTDKVHAWLFGG